MSKSKNKSKESSNVQPPKPKEVGWGIDQEKYDEARRKK